MGKSGRGEDGVQAGSWVVRVFAGVGVWGGALSGEEWGEGGCRGRYS
jgi:hypothetical protein